MKLETTTADGKKTTETITGTEHTFIENGEKYYSMISEKQIRDIIREEILEYNQIFMSQMKNRLFGKAEDVGMDLSKEEQEEFNDAQMLNGTFEGDTISQKGKRIKLKQSKKGLNTDPGNPDSGE